MTTFATTAGPSNEYPRLDRDQILQFGVWMFLATVTMLFAAFTSAYIVRRAGTDWRPIVLPPVLWLNTGVLVLSSLVLERGRRAADRGHWTAARLGFVSAMLLGVWFLGGQVAGWRVLVSQGVFVPTLPQASFFYMLTGVHAVHLVAGLLVLTLTVPRLRPLTASATVSAGTRAKLAATFWHFLGGLWIYLFTLMTGC